MIRRIPHSYFCCRRQYPLLILSRHVSKSTTTTNTSDYWKRLSAKDLQPSMKLKLLLQHRHTELYRSERPFYAAYNLWNDFYLHNFNMVIKKYRPRILPISIEFMFIDGMCDVYRAFEHLHAPYRFGRIIQRYRQRSAIKYLSSSQPNAALLADYDAIVHRSTQMFLMIAHAYHQNSINELIRLNIARDRINNEQPFLARINTLSKRQIDVFQLTDEDVIGIAPGVVGPYQRIRLCKHSGQQYIVYSVVAFAWHQKQRLYEFVDRRSTIDLLNLNAKDDLVDVCGYRSPRLIYCWMDVGLPIDDTKQQQLLFHCDIAMI